MKQKTNLRLLLPLLLACATLSANATVFFDDNFTAGSTTNGPSIPTGAATSYDIASTKGNVGGPVINPGDFTLKLNSATTSAFMEFQAVFTNSAVTLAIPGSDYVDYAVTFTNGAGTNTLFNGITSLMYMGLFDSGGSLPLAGDLANAGLNGTSGSPFATGNCANWKGYVAQMAGSGQVSRFFTRPIQNGAATTSANQELDDNGASTGGFANPPATILGITPATSPGNSFTITPGAVYTAYYRISLIGPGMLSFSNAIYAGTSTAGTLVYYQTNNILATNANFLTANFDGFSICLQGKTPSPGADPIIDITHIQIGGVVSPAPAPVITAQPVPASIATNAAGAFTITTMGFGQVYQWHRNGTNINNGGNFTIITSPDSSSSTLAISPAGLADVATGANGYWVTVTGAGNLSTNSTTNNLTLRPSTNLTYTAAGGTTWDVNTTASWKDPLGNTKTFNYGDSVTFDDSVGGTRAVTLSGPYLSASLVSFVNFGATYTLSGNGNIAGPSALNVLGGAVQLASANTYAGGTVLSNNNGIAPIVQLQNPSALGTGPLTFVPSGPGSLVELQVAGTASAGLPDIHVNEDATLQIDIGSNSFAGVILGGMYGTAGKTLTIEPAALLGTPPAADQVRLRVYGTNTTYDANLLLNGIAGQALYVGTVLAPYHNAGVQTYTGVISGNGGVVQRGNGATVFIGQSTYSGGTFPTAGQIGFGSDSVGVGPTTGPIGTGPLFVATEQGSQNSSGTVFSSGGAHTIANAVQWPSITNNQTLLIGGTNPLTFSGTVTLNALDNPALNQTNRILNVTNMALTTISGVITDNGHVFGLTKLGNGTLSLANTEAYSSNTIVLAGTLAVNGTLNGSGLFVGTNSVVTNQLSSTFLGGTGSISCPVVISNGAALAPGNSIGTLHVNNSLTLFGNMLIEVNTNLAQNCDQTIVSGALTNAGTGNLIITNIGTSALQTGNRFFVFNKAMSNGAALNILSPGITASWSNGLAVDGSIQILATIPITPTNITYVVTGPASAPVLTMSWPAGYLGWSLQSNSVGLLSTNSWFVIPGSSSGTSVTVPYDRTKTNVFFRMSLP